MTNEQSTMLDTIHIDGQKIGFQFNRQSQGTRTIRRRVHCKDGFPYIVYGGQMISVLPIHKSNYVFEAHHIIC